MNVFLSQMAFWLLAGAVLISPWLFGAWEMWWFWPFACLIFLSTAAFSLRLVLGAVSSKSGIAGAEQERNPARLVVLLLFVVFLCYACVRFLGANVFLDAERSFLLFLTPFLVGIQVVHGFTARQRRLLFMMVLADLFLLGLYGLVNHRLTGSASVLWREGHEQYLRENRATGSYFCPDHFSGIMELALSLGLSLLVTRRVRWTWKLCGGAISAVAVAGVLLSKSRGGGLTLAVIAVVILAWGFRRYRASVRTWWRLSLACAMAIAVLLLAGLGGSYTARFTAFFKKEPVGHPAAATIVGRTWDAARLSTRGRMIAGALRAWRTAPVFGIGPGMHQILWPHFSATSDGDADLGVWPSQTNPKIHSYEVHSDWVQLLEEYGIVGLVLFALPVGAAAWLLHSACWRETRKKGGRRFVVTDGTRHAIALGAFTACAAMAFHSLGDFNLQMPATTWLLASIASLGLFHATETEPSRPS